MFLRKILCLVCPTSLKYLKSTKEMNQAMSRLIVLTFILLLLSIYTWKSYLRVGLHCIFVVDRSLYG